MNDKLERLFSNSKWCKFCHIDRVVNISSFGLTDAMKTILGYGLSFALPPKADCLIKFLSDFDYFESKCQLGLDVAKGYFLNDIVNGLKSIKLLQRLLKALSELKNNNEIVVTCADKGGKIVIVDL